MAENGYLPWICLLYTICVGMTALMISTRMSCGGVSTLREIWEWTPWGMAATYYNALRTIEGSPISAIFAPGLTQTITHYRSEISGFVGMTAMATVGKKLGLNPNFLKDQVLTVRANMATKGLLTEGCQHTPCEISTRDCRPRVRDSGSHSTPPRIVEIFNPPHAGNQQPAIIYNNLANGGRPGMGTPRTPQRRPRGDVSPHALEQWERRLGRTPGVQLTPTPRRSMHDAYGTNSMLPWGAHLLPQAPALMAMGDDRGGPPATHCISLLGPQGFEAPGAGCSWRGNRLAPALSDHPRW